MSEVVISVENLSKEYRLGAITHRTLQRDIQAWWARLRGREDPNLPVDGGRYKRLEQCADENGIIHALKDVSFEVRQGEVLGIIGKNGAGKSTLLKILSRITAPTSGCVKIRGRIGSLLEVGTGFHPELTGRENIYMNGAILGMKKKEIDRKLDEIIDFAGVEQFIDTPVKRYSSGMYVRLAFAVAAHLDPEILLVDEVLAVGDAEFQKKCLGKMDDVSKKEGRTVLFVSHNMAAVKTLCSRGLLLDKGRASYFNDISQVIDAYLRESSFFVTTRESIYKTRDIIMKNPSLFNEKGNPQGIFAVGEPIVCRFEIEFLRAFKRFCLGIALNSINGDRILTLHSVDDKNFNITEPVKGKVIIECVVDLKILAPGKYYLLFGMRDEAGRNIIRTTEPVSLIIESEKDIDGKEGFLRCKGNWRLVR